MISQTKFKQLASIAKREITKSLPHVKLPIPRTKSGIQLSREGAYRDISVMSIYLSKNIILSVNTHNTFQLQIYAYVTTEERKEMERIAIDLLREQNIDGFFLPVYTKKKGKEALIALSGSYKQLLSWMMPFEEITFQKEKGFSMKLDFFPEFSFLLKVSKQKNLIQIRYSSFTKEFHSKEEFSSFIHGLKREIFIIKEKSNELKDFILSHKGTSIDEYNISIKLLGENISFGLAKTLSHESKNFMYFGWFLSYDIKGNLYEVMTKLKAYIHNYIVKNRLRNLYVPKKEAQ